MIVLRSEIPSGMCAKLRTVAASNNRDHPTRSLCYCLFAPLIYIVVLRAHFVRGESHNQRNATGEVATTSPPFYNEPHRSHVLFVKAAPGTTFHILVTAPFCCDRKSPSGMCAKLCTVAASNNRDHPTRSLYYCLFAPPIYLVVLRAHPVRGESHNQRNATGEVATIALVLMMSLVPMVWIA